VYIRIFLVIEGFGNAVNLSPKITWKATAFQLKHYKFAPKWD